jgi:hypothetical protein
MQPEQPAAIDLVGIRARVGADRQDVDIDLVFAVRKGAGFSSTPLTPE